MKRYWVSWISGDYEDEGCTTPPFKVWITGYRGRVGTNDRDDCTICAVIDSEDEDSIWELIGKHFPDYEERFIDERSLDWNPGERFQ